MLVFMHGIVVHRCHLSLGGWQQVCELIFILMAFIIVNDFLFYYSNLPFLLVYLLNAWHFDNLSVTNRKRITILIY